MSDERDQAAAFFQSMRGQFIIGQALVLAIKEINSRPEVEREPSNVADMAFLVDNLFPMYRAVSTAPKEHCGWERT